MFIQGWKLGFSRGRDQRATWCSPEYLWPPNTIRISDIWSFCSELPESIMIIQEIILATVTWLGMELNYLNHRKVSIFTDKETETLVISISSFSELVTKAELKL